MKYKKWFAGTAIGYGVFTFLFFAGQIWADSRGMEYRTWVSVWGYFIFWILSFGLGGSAFVRGAAVWKKRRQTGKWPGWLLALFVAYLTAAAVLSLLAGVWGLFGVRTERRIKGTDQIEVTVSNFLNASTTYLCEPVGIFFRRPLGEESAEVIKFRQEKILKELESRYATEFSVAWEDDEICSYVPKTYPDLRIRAGYDSFGEWHDNFAEAVLAFSCEKTWKKGAMTCTYELLDSLYGKRDQFVLILSDKEQMDVYVKEAARLLAAAQQEEIFRRCQAQFICDIQTPELSRYVYITVGGPVVPVRNEAQWQEELTLELEKAWELSAEEAQENGEEEFANDASFGEELSEYQVDQAARQIFEQIWKEQGCIFEKRYDAKGNLYYDLGTVIQTVDGQQTEVSRRLVYDRISKNGACALFALNGTDLSAGQMTLLDYYGVELSDGVVAASGKHSYKDVGSEEYQKLTGEP